MWMWTREGRVGVHHNFAPICYLGVNGIRGHNGPVWMVG
jgi:hypothetical protein